MIQRIEKITNPLIQHRLFDTVENAVETVTLHYVQDQVQKYKQTNRTTAL